MTTQKNSIDANVFDGEKVVLTSSALDFLNSASKWSRFIGIIGFVFVGVLALAPLVIEIVIAQMQLPFMIPTVPFTIMFLFVAIVLFFPVFFLFRFSIKAQEALKSQNSQALQSAFRSLKLHYKYIGILIIIYIALFLLGLLLSKR